MGDTQIAQIVFSGSANKSETEYGGAQPVVVNAIPDATGALRRRPGVSASTAFQYVTTDRVNPTPEQLPIIGMMPFGDYLVYVTADRFVHAVVPGQYPVSLSTVHTGHEALNRPTQLAGAARPSMVAGRQMMLIAGGAQIQKWYPGITAPGGGSTNLSERLVNNGTGGPPPSASFLCAVAQRLVALVPDGSGQIWWSGPLEDYENWDMATGGSGYIQAAAKPDPIMAMFDNTNEVFAFGSETIQVFAPAALNIDVNDPTNLLDFSPSRTMNIGTVSPHSVVAVDDTFALLDRQRRIVITDARSYNDISRPIAQTLRDMKSISDAWGFRMRFGRFDCIVWMFPTDGFGLVYDTQTSNWSEWREVGVVPGSAFDTVADDRFAEQPVSITSVYNWAEKGMFLVGLSDGTIAVLDDSSKTDLAAFPNPDGFIPVATVVTGIKVEVQSGFTDHGTTAQKHCKTLLLKFKRTLADLPIPTTSPANAIVSPSGVVRISKRDDIGDWKLVKEVQLSSNRSPAIQIRSLGVYRTRQWKVEYSGGDELQMVSAQEEYEILGA
jgi:hypothetical protein